MDDAIDEADRLREERDEAREKLSEWEDAAKHVEADHKDEVHCGCVPVLRKLLADAQEDAKRATYDAAQETIKVSTVKSHWIEACRERDEARAEVANLREALRVCVLWAESVSGRVTEDRDSINWTGLQVAREALAAKEAAK